MRILHINCNYVGTALHRVMVNKFIELGTDVTVFTPIAVIKEKNKFNPEANEHISVCFHKWDRVLYFYKQSKILQALKREVAPITQFDVIHAFTLMTDGNVAYKIWKETGIPYIVAVRDTDVNSFFRIKPYLRPLGIEIMRHASAVCFLSKSYMDHVLKDIVPEKYRDEISRKAHIVPNGIDQFWLSNKYTSKIFSYNKSRIDNKELIITIVARINKRKNIPFVQEALKILRDSGWQVKINVIGKVEDKSEFERIKLDQMTTVYPPTNKEGLIKYYRSSDIFVLVSHTETFGLVYAEAMSQGLPVIYTRGQGFDGQFDDGVIGYAVSDKIQSDLLEKIKMICENYETIAGSAVHSVDKFDWDLICKEYIHLYRRIADGRNSV